ncbi:MAG: M56 family metallopeptidase [Planctomycetes bacterium]|nr:M56 family metallopeptidase [Planctomycetota bacterium]
MPSVVESLNHISENWTELMWAVLWQSTLLVGVVAVIAILLGRSSPVVRYWLWQIVAIKLLLMPFWTLAVPIPSLFDTKRKTYTITLNEPAIPLIPVEDSPAGQLDRKLPADLPGDRTPAASVTSASYREITWQSWLLWTWLVVVLTQIMRVVWLRIRLGQMLRTAVPAPGELAALLQNATELLGLKRVPQVVLTEFDCSPFVCGIFRPVIVLPKSLTSSFDPKRMQQVLLHELAHVKRLDLLWGWIPEIARIIYFFHPFVHWVSYRIRLERELSCDQLAMAHSGQNAADYADTLVQVVSHTSEPAMLKTTAATSAGLNGDEAVTKQKQQSN